MPEQMTMPSPTSDDLYGDGAAPAEQKPAEQEPKEEKSSEPTAVLPKSILAGKEFKPGDELVLKVVALHDDEVEVQYAKEPEKAETPAAAPANPGNSEYD